MYVLVPISITSGEGFGPFPNYDASRSFAINNGLVASHRPIRLAPISSTTESTVTPEGVC